ncbi:MAG: hypothetical protein KGL39_56000 [Patescibacteria group bacterium]|nr:hypothetical protein [Patescibacteria group bacterium]
MADYQLNRERLNNEQIAKNITMSQRLREAELSRKAFEAMNAAHKARGEDREACEVAKRMAYHALDDAIRERAESWKLQLSALDPADVSA